MSDTNHTNNGNCWAPAYECPECNAGGRENLCDVCHLHCEPRGDCSECARCKACDDEDTRTP